MSTYRVKFCCSEETFDVTNCNFITIESGCYNAFDVSNNLIFSAPMDAVSYMRKLPVHVVK